MGEDDAYKKQKAKDFAEFQDVMDQENKLWKRITRLNLWRRKGQIREQNEKGMEDYLANSEAAFKSREDKIVEEQARLAEATAAVKAAKSEKEMETEKYMADLAAREKDGTGPMPVTPEARDGKMPAGVAKEEKKGADTRA